MRPSSPIAYLQSISKRGIKPELERMQTIMSSLGNPQTKFKAIHVTGTNGKGSVASMLESILRESGIKTGLYTSPHLLDIRERIKVCGEMIDIKSFRYWIQKIRFSAKAVEPEMTYFELLTAASFCYFAHKKVQLAVIEIGLGGRFDATNIIPPPEICIITNIAQDHTEYLGTSESQIAREKAGIIKEGCFCITQSSGRALSIIRESCTKIKAHLIPPAYKAKQSKTLLNYGNLCALKGSYQKKNISLVLDAVRILKKKKWRIPKRSLIRGLKNVDWPCRFDWRKISTTRSEIPILLDGAHNPAAVKELVHSIKRHPLHLHPCDLVFNTLKDKSTKSMAKLLLKHLKIRKVFIPKLETPRTNLPYHTTELFKQLDNNINTSTFASVAKMWPAIKEAGKDLNTKWILFTGSLVLAGECLREIILEES